MAHKRVEALALDRGRNYGWDADAQPAVVGQEFACVASRLGVRRSEPVLRRDLGVGRELVGVSPAVERRVLRPGARWEEEDDALVVDVLSDERRGVPLGGVRDQSLPVLLVALVCHHLHCLSEGALQGIGRGTHINKQPSVHKFEHFALYISRCSSSCTQFVQFVSGLVHAAAFDPCIQRLPVRARLGGKGGACNACNACNARSACNACNACRLHLFCVLSCVRV